MTVWDIYCTGETFEYRTQIVALKNESYRYSLTQTIGAMNIAEHVATRNYRT